MQHFTDGASAAFHFFWCDPINFAHGIAGEREVAITILIQTILKNHSRNIRDDVAQTLIGRMFGRFCFFGEHGLLQAIECCGQLPNFVFFPNRQGLASDFSVPHVVQ